MQVYNVQIDQASLRPAIEAEYVITNVKTGQEVQRIREDGKNGISDLSGYGQQIVLGRLIPLEKLEPGSYEITVVVTDKVARKTLTPKTFFTVEPPNPDRERGFRSRPSAGVEAPLCFLPALCGFSTAISSVKFCPTSPPSFFC